MYFLEKYENMKRKTKKTRLCQLALLGGHDFCPGFVYLAHFPFLALFARGLA